MYSRGQVILFAVLITAGCLIVIIFVVIAYIKGIKLDTLLRKCCCRETRLMRKKRQAVENPYILDNRGFLGRQPATLTDDVELATHADMAILRQSIRQSIRDSLPPRPQQTASVVGSSNEVPNVTDVTNTSRENLVNGSTLELPRNAATKRHGHENSKSGNGMASGSKNKSDKSSRSQRNNTDGATGATSDGSPNQANVKPGAEIEYANVPNHDVHLPSRSRNIVSQIVDSSDDESFEYPGEIVECSITDLSDRQSPIRDNYDVYNNFVDDISEDSDEKSNIEELSTKDTSNVSLEYVQENFYGTPVTNDPKNVLLEYVPENFYGAPVTNDRPTNGLRKNLLISKANRPSSFANDNYYDVRIHSNNKRHTCLGLSSSTDDQNDIYENHVACRPQTFHQIYENVSIDSHLDYENNSEVNLYADHIFSSLQELDKTSKPSGAPKLPPKPAVKNKILILRDNLNQTSQDYRNSSHSDIAS